MKTDSSSSSRVSLASFQLSSLLSNLDLVNSPTADEISSCISILRSNSLLLSVQNQISYNNSDSTNDSTNDHISSEGIRVLKSYLSTTTSLIRSNSTNSSKILLGTLLAIEFIQQLGLHHYLISSTSTSTSSNHLEQWLLSLLSPILSSDQSKNFFLSTNISSSTTTLAGKILDLLSNHLLGGKAAQKVEYNRNVVVKNVPKLGNGLMGVLETLQGKIGGVGGLRKENEKILHLLLKTLDLQLLLHTSLYRPLSSRLHSLLLMLLFSPLISTSTLLIRTISISISHLHLTGIPAPVTMKPSAHNSNTNTRLNQPLLWKITVEQTIGSSIEVWKVFIQDFPRSKPLDREEETLLKVASRLDSDVSGNDGSSVQNLNQSFNKLKVLIGPKGLLNTLLNTSTSRYIPLPASKIISFVSLILSTFSSSSSSSSMTSIDHTLFSHQKSHLPEIYMMALNLGLQVLATIEDQITISHGDLGPKFLDAILNLLSNKEMNSNPNLKNSAFKTLAVLICNGGLDMSSMSNSGSEGSVDGIGMLLDPSSRNLVKIARFSLGQIGKFLSGQTESSASSTSTSNSIAITASSSSRQAKRPKLDPQATTDQQTIQLQNQQLWPNSMSSNSFSSTKASISLLVNLYPFFQTKLNKNLSELESLTQRILLAFAELLCGNRGLGGGNVSFLLESSSSFTSTSNDTHTTNSMRKLDSLTTLVLSSLNQILKSIEPKSASFLLPRILKLTNNFSVKGNGLTPQIFDVCSKLKDTMSLLLDPRSVPFSRSEDLEEEEEEFPEDEELDGDGKKGKGTKFNDSEKLKVKNWGVGGSELAEHEHEQVDQDLDEDEDVEMKEVKFSKEVPDAFKQTLNGDSTSTIPKSTITMNTSKFSPDPVKSIRRPSTPRIGSPNSKTSSSFNGNEESSTSMGSLDAGVVFRELKRGGRQTKEVEAEKLQVKPQGPEEEEEDEDDDAMPTIDMRDSEDEIENEDYSEE